MKTVAVLFVGLCLTSCSTLQPGLKISEPRIVRVPGATRYVAVPEELTTPLSLPPKPVPLCIDSTGWAVLCDFQIALWIRAWEAKFNQANIDRAAVAILPVTPLASPEEGTPAG